MSELAAVAETTTGAIRNGKEAFNIDSLEMNVQQTAQGKLYSQVQLFTSILQDISPEALGIETEKFSFEVDSITRNIAEVLLLKNVFTEEEADKIISVSESIGYESLEGLYSSDYRNNDRIMIDDVSFCDTWFQRMIPYISKFVERVETRREEDYAKSGYDFASYGEITCLNNRLRLCRYTKNGLFLQHYDAAAKFIDSSSNAMLASKFTVMAYLNDIPDEEGGATRFYQHDGVSPTLSIHPRRGHVVIFPHKLLHDGELCQAERKYIIRSDVMFRIPS